MTVSPTAIGWPEACGVGNRQRDLSLTGFTQLKMSLYLDPLTKHTGPCSSHLRCRAGPLDLPC